jgi:hydrogenase maturation protease
VKTDSGRGGAQPRPFAVLGMGNVLLGDDGLGPEVVGYILAHYRLPDTVDCEDIGTPGLDLTPYLSGRRGVILVDTVAAEKPPGSVRIYRREEIASALVTNRLSPHDPGLAECIATLELADDAPGQLFVVGVVPEACATGIGLSSSVQAAVPEAAREVARLLESLGVTPELRETPLPTDNWWSAKVGS